MQHRVMTCVFPVFIVLLVLVPSGSADHEGEESDKELPDEAVQAYTPSANISPATPKVEGTISMPDGMARAMKEFRIAADLARKQAQDGILPQEDTDKQYAKMALMVEEILDYMYCDEHAYSFLQVKGLNTIIAPNLDIAYPQLRNPLLQLIKALFDIAPTTTMTIIPKIILEKLVEIFEQDDNLPIKSHAIELLSVWLPGNPQAQAHVMKMKGLEPFYKQLSKLESPLTERTLELFNKIINEHVVARNTKVQKNKADYRILQLYQQIGLIERLSTPKMCKGLLNIFHDIFTFGSPDNNVILPILKLVHTIKPHCSKVLYENSKASALIDQMLEYVQKPNIRLYLDKMGLNVTETVECLTDFADLVKLKHSEL